MRGAVAVTVLLGCTGLALGAGASPAAAAPLGGARSWSPPVALLSASHSSFSPELAVSSDGRVVMAWFGGTPPKVSLGPNAAPGSNLQQSRWRGAEMEVDLGSVRGGFGRPLVLSRRGTDVEGQLLVAMSGSNVAYAAWLARPHDRWMIATIRPHDSSSARPLLPPRSQLLTLTAVQNGPVMAVWNAVGPRDRITMKYGLLNADGQLRRSAAVTRVQPDDTYPQLSGNDKGRLVAAWTRQGLGAAATPRVMATVCAAVGRCSVPQTLALGLNQPSDEVVAATISDSGRVTVLAAGHSIEPDGENSEQGLWDAVGKVGGSLGAMALVSPSGGLPVAAPDGPAGALATFNQGPTPVRRLAWSVLGGSGASFSPPSLVADPDTVGPAVLAANRAAQFVVAWVHAGGPGSGSQSIRAALGDGDSMGSPQLVVPTRDGAEAEMFKVGIDGQGDAILVWNEERGRDRNGVFCSIHRAPG